MAKAPKAIDQVNESEISMSSMTDPFNYLWYIIRIL